jgi:hypothetical protein
MRHLGDHLFHPTRVKPGCQTASPAEKDFPKPVIPSEVEGSASARAAIIFRRLVPRQARDDRGGGVIGLGSRRGSLNRCQLPQRGGGIPLFFQPGDPLFQIQDIGMGAAGDNNKDHRQPNEHAAKSGRNRIKIEVDNGRAKERRNIELKNTEDRLAGTIEGGLHKGEINSPPRRPRRDGRRRDRRDAGEIRPPPPAVPA